MGNTERFILLVLLLFVIARDSLEQNVDREFESLKTKRELGLVDALGLSHPTDCRYSHSLHPSKRHCCIYIQQYAQEITQKVNETIWNQCEAKYNSQPPSGKKLYSIGPDKVKWNDAILRCEKEGQHLATVKSAEEEQELQETMIRHGMTNKGFEKMWLGGNDNQEFGKFKWLGRPFVPFKYTNWDKDEPLVGLKEHRCMAAVARTFSWRRDHCTHRNWYACEYQQTP